VLAVVAPDAIEAPILESGIEILRFPRMRIVYIAMNTQREPLKDVTPRLVEICRTAVRQDFQRVRFSKLGPDYGEAVRLLARALW